MGDANDNKSFWTILIGLLTGLAALITAVATLWPHLQSAKDPINQINKNLNNTYNSQTNNVNNNPSTNVSNNDDASKRPPEKTAYLMTRNTSTYIGNNSWNWTVYIDADPVTLSQIECVEYTLHPTFPNPLQRVCTRETKFALSSNGWGTFEIGVRVIFRNRAEKYLSHMLKFGN